MANILFRLGKFSFLHHKAVISAWLTLIAVLASIFLSLGSAPVSGITIPGTESQRSLDELRTEFPSVSGATGMLVVKAPSGESLYSEDNRVIINSLVLASKQVPGVVGVLDPYISNSVSPTKRHAIISIQFKETREFLTSETIEGYNALSDISPDGWVFAAASITENEHSTASSSEGIGVAVAMLVLLLTFGSMAAAGMTMLNALLGVLVGFLGIMISSHIFDMTSVTPVIALMLGLAVGIDYSLFITTRYRHNLAIGMQPSLAAGKAVGTAGSAVVFAGLTVIIALSALSVVGIPFLTSMGLAASATVSIAVLVALTLLPALLRVIGNKILSRNQRLVSGVDIGESGSNFGFNWAKFVIRHRLAALSFGFITLTILALPSSDMRLVLPDDGSAKLGSNSRVAYDTITEGFGAGANGRLLVVINSSKSEFLKEGIDAVIKSTSSLPGIVAVMPPVINSSVTTSIISLVPSSGPTDEVTVSLVKQLRTIFSDVENDTGTDISITGATALGIDISEKLRNALPIYLLLVVGFSFLLLMLVFRSILVPLKATLGFLLTIAATFGVTVSIFQKGWFASFIGVDTPGPLISFLPILLIGILFGLAMDYELFLLSRMREDFVHGSSSAESIISGVGHGARVVVAAGVIMIAVFSGFALSPDVTTKSIAASLAIGVFIDAFVIRLLLVPAVMSFLGDKAWWLPQWINKRLPNVDIEGESIKNL